MVSEIRYVYRKIGTEFKSIYWSEQDKKEMAERDYFLESVDKLCIDYTWEQIYENDLVLLVTKQDSGISRDVCKMKKEYIPGRDIGSRSGGNSFIIVREVHLISRVTEEIKSDILKVEAEKKSMRLEDGEVL
jgi:hypothetical protein